MEEVLLHACRRGDLRLVQRLVAQGVNVECRNRGYCNETPLHCAAQNGHLPIVQYLIKDCKSKPDCRNDLGNTPLHDASWNGHLPIVQYLIEDCKSKPDCCNYSGNNDLGNTPLHYASWNGHLPIVQYLIEDCKSKPDCCNYSGSTPLHYASWYGHLPIVQYLIEDCKSKPDCCNYSGSTPLHYASRNGHLPIVQYLIKDCKSKPDCRNDLGNTPLHDASWHGHLPIVQYLIEDCKSKPDCCNYSGSTPLHYASRRGHLPIVQYLIEDRKCSPDCRNNLGETPLHDASGEEKLDVVKYLIEDQQCKPDVTSKSGYTPLHHASAGSLLSSDDEHQDSDCDEIDDDTRFGKTAVVRYLLASVHCNPNCPNKNGQTPLDLARDTTIVRELIHHGASTKNVCTKYNVMLPEGCPKNPAEAGVNTFILGNVGAGKSTLTKALSKDHKGISRVAGWLTKVSGVEEKTAGIIPHQLDNDRLGRVTLYDFAGHREFYSSHECLLHNAMRGSSGAVFLLLADLSKSNEEFRDTLLYWLSFLDNQYSSKDTTSNQADLTSSKPLSSHDTNPKAHIIIVGSRADQTKPSAEKKGIVSSLKSTYPTFHFAGFVAIDCRFAESSAMTELRQCLAQSCTSLRHSTFMSFHSHCFLIYLLDKFRDSPAVSLNEVSTTVQTDSKEAKVGLLSFIPDSLSGLCSSCEELNARGNLLFIKSSSNIRDSWLILDRETLLTEVTGTVFAPAAFKQHQDLASSTGVVPLSKIAAHFPSLNPHMIANFLCHLEFCHEISDHKVLKLLQEPAVSASEKYFFFPALVSIDAPALWEADASYSHHSAWLLQCTHAREFFTPRFLQVLLLRLAFSFALASDGQEVNSELPALQRKCSVWKNGIYWCNRQGVEALVEVREDSRRVAVMVRCQKGSEIASVYLRSATVLAVLHTQAEFCPRVSTFESFLHPDDAVCYPLQPKCNPLTIAEVATAITEEAPYVVPTDGPAIKLEALLHFEPYIQLGERILQLLFNEESPEYHKQLEDTFLKRILDKVQAKLEPASEVFKPAAVVLQHLKEKPSHATCKSVRKELEQFSLFAGRNLLKLAGYKPLTSEEPPAVDPSSIKKPARTPTKCMPRLYELQRLRGRDGSTVRVITTIAHQWESIAYALHFGHEEVAAIRRDMVHGVEAACEEFLGRWLSGKHLTPVTWESLLEALRDCNFTTLARDLEDILL